MWSWVALNHSTQQTPLMSLNSMTSRLIHLIQFWHRTIFIFSPDLNNKKHGTPRGPKGHPPKNYKRSYGEWGVFNLSRSRPWVSEARWNSLGLDIRKVSFTSKICTKRNSSHDIFRYDGIYGFLLAISTWFSHPVITRKAGLILVKQLQGEGRSLAQLV
jgi:hypothetical protein